MKKQLLPAYLLTFVNVLGFSILMPVLPFVVKDYGAPEWVYGLLLSMYSAFQFIGAPILGKMSDERGRRPILFISQAGTLISWVVFLLALYLPAIPIYGFALPLWIVLFSRILDGITGGNISVTNAYVADITTPKEKTYVFGYIGGITGIGLMIGPGLGGWTASSSWGYSATFVTAIAISAVALLSIFFWLKESLPKKDRQAVKKHPVLHSFLITKQIRDLNPSGIIRLLFVLKLLFSIMSASYMGTIVLYVIDLFDFDKKEVGMFMLAVGAFLAFNQVVMVQLFIKKLGPFKTLVVGLSMSVLGMYLITLTDNLIPYLIFYYVLNLGFSLCYPTFTALISIHADPKKQGEVMGISESINSFAMTVFPVVAAAIYGIMGFKVYYLIGLFPLFALIGALKGRKEFLVESAAVDVEN